MTPTDELELLHTSAGVVDRFGPVALSVDYEYQHEDDSTGISSLRHHILGVGLANSVMSGKGLGSGLTLGLAGSEVVDGYEMTAIYTPAEGYPVTKTYNHAIHTTIGLHSAPKGMEPLLLADAFDQVGVAEVRPADGDQVGVPDGDRGLRGLGRVAAVADQRAAVDFAELRQGFLQYLPVGAIVGFIFLTELLDMFMKIVLLIAVSSTSFMMKKMNILHAVNVEKSCRSIPVVAQAFY